MNLFLTALKPTGEAIRKTDLFAFLARMPRDVECESFGYFSDCTCAISRSSSLKPAITSSNTVWSSPPGTS